MRFIRYNANPKDWKIGDCVVRACAVANQITWEEAYEELCNIGKKKCRMPNDDCTIEAFLKENGFITMKQEKDVNGNWLDVEQLIEAHPDDILVIRVAHHLTVSIKGVLIDTWNCCASKTGRFYVKMLPKNEEGEIIRYLQFLDENKMKVRVRL